MNVAILISLILLNGVFAMSEIALVTARKSRLQRLAEDGDKPAAIAVRLGEEPTQFNRVLKNKNQAVRQGARRCDKRSIFKHM